MAAGYDGSIRIDSRIDGKSFNAGIKALIGSLGKLAAAMGIAFGVAAVVSFGKEAVNAASQMNNALTGLKSVLDAQGRSFSDAQKFINDYVADGLVPATNAIATYKNLAARGYDDSQIRKIMTVMKDSAAFNRQSAFTMGEAIQKASEGLKNENSLLTDSVGITKNVAKMWDDYAKAHGKTAANLTLEEKRIAEVNGFVQEGRYFMGDAAKAANTYSGRIAALGTSFENLKRGIGNSIIPIINAMLPAIKTAVDWLTQLFNTISQYIQAWFGYDPSATMEATAAASQDAADAQQNLADQTEAARKAAEGSLAAFDQLNVLQQKQPEQPALAPAVSPTEGQDKQPPGGVSAEIQARVDAFKERIRETWESVKTWATEAWAKVKEVWGVFSTWFIENVWTPFSTWFQEKIWKPVSEWAVQAWEDIKTAWGETVAWFQENVFGPIGEKFGWFVDVAKTSAKQMYEDFIEPLAEWFMTNLWPIIQQVIGWIVEKITGFVDTAKSVFRIGWNTLVSVAKNGWTMITGVVNGIITTLGGIIEFVTGVFTGDWKLAWQGVKDIFKGIFETIGSVIKGVVNTVIDLVNGMIQAVTTGINAIINGLNKLSVGPIPAWVATLTGVPAGSYWGFNLPPLTAPQIPRLATGAVIPPNAEFLAVLGDQRNGRNLEAPEGLIRQIIQEEIGKVQADVTIEFGGSLGQLVRTLKPYIDRENVRIGGSLIKGATT